MLKSSDFEVSFSLDCCFLLINGNKDGHFDRKTEKIVIFFGSGYALKGYFIADVQRAVYLWEVNF
jgi:hypothetical protein